MVLMAMEFLAFHDQLVADLTAYEQNDNLVLLDIIQGTQVSRPQFEIGKKIGTQTLDGLRRLRRFVFQPRLDRRFQDSLLTDRQPSQLPVSILGNRDLEGHGTSVTLRIRASKSLRGAFGNLRPI